LLLLQCATVTIDRMELERLLAERPAGNRSAMQAVRDSYDDVSLMRERGLSWSEISEMLARFGVTARDGQPIAPVTLRSAFFLVGNEQRSGLPVEGEEAVPQDIVDAIHRAVIELAEPAADGSPEAPVPAEPPSAPAPATDVAAAEPAPAGPPPVPAGPQAAPGTLLETAGIPAETAPVPAPPAFAPLAAAPVRPPPPSVPPVDAARRRAPEFLASHPDSPSEPVKGHHMLGTIFVLNDRGGVGKTLLSHHLMATAMLEGLQLRVVEYEVNERLARLYGPEVVEHRRITQDFMNLMGSGDGFFEYWDQIGPELQRGGRLFDFGGNISQWFFNWAEVSGFDYYIGQGERLTFMVPVTVDLASLQTGMATLDRIAVIAPKAKRVLVENGISGPFTQLDESQYGRRKAEMVEREGVEVISMPSCSAPAWARLTGHRLDQVAQMTREDLVKLGMTPPVASRSLIIIHDWLRMMRTALSPYLHDAFRNTTGAASKTGAGRGAD
jgi:hypothetical protein